jgi:glyoxylase-like metal-dependent hydrolase (beta-lactamase superfamily II)
MQRLTLGDFELTVFSDGTYPLDGGAFFGVVPQIMWSRKLQADDRNYVTAGLNSLLIRTEHPRNGKQTVLIETGMGNKLSDRMKKFYGQPAKLLDNLSAAGIAPEDIDIVINSHLHFDHCGWNTVRDQNGKIVPTFPRAKYYAPEGEWQYARKPSERDAISYIPENYDPLVATGQMTLLKGGEEIVPGISVETFRGHTANMQAIIIRGNPRRQNSSNVRAPLLPDVGKSGDFDSNASNAVNVSSTTNLPSATNASHTVEERPFQGRVAGEEDGALAPVPTACYISDLIPTSAHIDLTWGMAFDLYPLDTIESKKRYYAQAIPENWLTVFTHDPNTPWAYIEQDDSGKMIAKGD